MDCSHDIAIVGKPLRLLQYSTALYSTAKYSAVQYIRVSSSTVRVREIRGSRALELVET